MSGFRRIRVWQIPILLLVLAFVTCVPAAPSSGVPASDDRPAETRGITHGTLGDNQGGGPPGGPPSPTGEGDPDDFDLTPEVVVSLLLRTKHYLVAF